MANIVVTSSTNSIKADFGAYYPTTTPIQKGTFNKSCIASIELFTNWVQVITTGSEMWRVSLDGSDNSMIIDTVDTATPSSLSDLYDKLIALLA